MDNKILREKLLKINENIKDELSDNYKYVLIVFENSDEFDEKATIITDVPIECAANVMEKYAYKIKERKDMKIYTKYKKGEN